MYDLREGPVVFRVYRCQQHYTSTSRGASSLDNIVLTRDQAKPNKYTS